MTPAELLAALEDRALRVASSQGVAASGARRGLDGFRVPGHRVSLRGSRVRVSGPQAPMVAREAARRAARGVQQELREDVS